MISVQDKQYRLSVLLVTYNHKKYIQQALTTLFGQTIEGPIQLVIADDGSMDSTLNIIKEYEEGDSRFCFKYLENTSNLGITKNYQRGFAACAGEYVAVLEGDDYWINPMKLKRQCDFLDAHWECDLCSVNYFVYEEDRAQFSPRTTIGNGYRLISARDLIADNLVGNFSTCMYRKSALDALPRAIYEIKSYDWIVNICIARKSLIGFLEQPMSIYRLHENGVWTQTSSVEKLKEQVELIPAYDELTNYTFHADFEMLANYLKHHLTASQLEKTMAPVGRPLAKFMSVMADYMPPGLLVLAIALLPPKLKRFITRMIHRSIA